MQALKKFLVQYEAKRIGTYLRTYGMPAQSMLSNAMLLDTGRNFSLRHSPSFSSDTTGLYIEDTIKKREISREALKALPADIQQDRLRRIWRANDLFMKHEQLPAELQRYNPLLPYGLRASINQVSAKHQEKVFYKTN